MIRSVSPEFWEGKRVLITGHTGFKGTWLSIWLRKMGAHLRGVALEPETSPSMFNETGISGDMEHCIADIRDLSIMRMHVEEFCPDIIIHMAAQPLVRLSYQKPVETFEVNVMGTINVLEAAKFGRNIKAIVNVTTDKCYENREWLWGYREDDRMGGYDPYSSSKGCVELLSSAYRKAFLDQAGISMATARAGNVIGGGDWSLDRLIPDIVRSIAQDIKLEIRNPKATRPWQHVLEPLSGYLLLAESLYSEGGSSFAEGWNFGPLDGDSRSVEWIVKHMLKSTYFDVSWGSQQGEHPHEANFLKLDISKAQKRLNWAPRWRLETALSHTISWYNSWINKKNMKEMCIEQIEEYNMSGLN